MNRVTERMLAFARDFAAELNIELPTTTDADGETVMDESYDAISEFLAANKDDYYHWNRS
jgi:hypothetical protein